MDEVLKIFNAVKAQNWLGGRQIGNSEYERGAALEWTNTSTYQLGIFGSNMGLFNRSMYIEGHYRVPDPIKEEILPLVHFMASSAAHVFLTAEADSLLGGKAQEI